MDFIYNALMASVKTQQEHLPQSAEKKSGSDSFQKLMDRRQSADDSAAVSGQEQPQQSQGSQPQEAEAVQPVQDPRELEKRMAMAAMAAAQSPEVAALVTDIAEETPQILTDPNWEDGFVPVGYDDYDGYRIVHWMRAGEDGEDLQSLNEQAGTLLEEQADTGSAVKDSVLTKHRVSDAGTQGLEIHAENTEELPDEAPAETPLFEDVRAVPVKVAEAPAKETTETEHIGKQIGDQLVNMTAAADGNGNQSVTIQLEPANLGKLRIEMSLNEDGVLHVTLSAENHRTAGLLERHSGELAGLLGRYVEKDVQVEVPRQENQHRQDLYDQQQQQQQQHRQQEQRQGRKESGEDFLHQLRLGLLPMDGDMI